MYDQHEMDGFFSTAAKVATAPVRAVFNPVKTLTNITDFIKSGSAQAIASKQAIDEARAAFKPPPVNIPAAPNILQTTTQALSERRLSRDEIREIQHRLNQAGFAAGPEDGIYGPKTAAGIQAYQRASGLPVTGVLSVGLLASLRGGGAQAPSVAKPSPPSAQVYEPGLVPETRGAPAFTFTPYVAPGQNVPSPSGGLPSWAIPAAIAGGLLLFVMMEKR